MMLQFVDQITQEWYEQLQSTSSICGKAGNKLRTYRMFKNIYEYEPYLSTVMKVNHRIALSCLRVSCHSLEIEVGRYKKPTPTPPESRLSRHCHLVEDEIHFLCDCVQFIDLREDLLQTASFYIPSIMLMSSTEKFTTLFHCTRDKCCS